MKSLWNQAEAAGFTSDLEQRAYSSRLLGREPALVMHGGGNTSVKGKVTNLFGEDEEVLFVKGSGWDLETIEQAGFAPCRMRDLIRLAQLDKLTDRQMAIELKKSMTDPNAPAPSVEAILHAVLPAKFVDHTHADAVLTITNTPTGLERVHEVWGDRVVIVPYVMPGFLLARLVAELFPKQAHAGTIGMLLMNHGMFSFGSTAEESYERMIELVSLAEAYIDATIGSIPSGPSMDRVPSDRSTIARLRKAVATAAKKPVILKQRSDSETLAFVRRPDAAEISQQGPATPDHVIRTKRTPLFGRDVDGFVQSYRDYFAEHGNGSLTMLDPAPRVILDADLGMLAVGGSAKDAAIVDDIYRHTMAIIEKATALGGWLALPAADIFDVEYWDLEQAKLRKAGPPAQFAGEICLITGAASGIGKACVSSFLKRGAAVVGVDLNPSVQQLHQRPDYLGLVCDLTDTAQVEETLNSAVSAFGGLDMLILNAGIFPKSSPIAAMADDAWQRTMSINLDSSFRLLRQCHPLLAEAARDGRIVVIGSKNVPAPGPGAAAYSASKAALQQLARVAALEWGGDHIRINTLHPNGVFDTGIWTEEVLATRAKCYGITVEEYKSNNVLKVEVTSNDVAELAAELCGATFAKVTGAQIPIDGGNERVI